jgi:hypothetical protein
LYLAAPVFVNPEECGLPQPELFVPPLQERVLRPEAVFLKQVLGYADRLAWP